VLFRSNVICYNLYGYLLKKYSATLVSFVGFTQLIFATAYGRIFLGEHVEPYFIVASGIILVGLYIFYSEELKQGTLSTE
jgi:drug/metabolite transporter (DMT)-like permease